MLAVMIVYGKYLVECIGLFDNKQEAEKLREKEHGVLFPCFIYEEDEDNVFKVGKQYRRILEKEEFKTGFR